MCQRQQQAPPRRLTHAQKFRSTQSATVSTYSLRAVLTILYRSNLFQHTSVKEI